MPTADLLVLWRVFEHCDLACQFCGYSRAFGARAPSAQCAATARSSASSPGPAAGRLELARWGTAPVAGVADSVAPSGMTGSVSGSPQTAHLCNPVPARH